MFFLIPRSLSLVLSYAKKSFQLMLVMLSMYTALRNVQKKIENEIDHLLCQFSGIQRLALQKVKVKT